MKKKSDLCKTCRGSGETEAKSLKGRLLGIVRCPTCWGKDYIPTR